MVFASGTYTITKHLTAKVPGITLYGTGATIKATNPTDGALMISADKIAVYNLTLTQNSTTRQTTPWAGGISVIQTIKSAPQRIRGAIVQGNTVLNSAAVGIFVFRADGFTIANNVIKRSLADGIHVTAGSSFGRVIDNTVTQNGDDMIAIVSFAGNRSNDPASVRYKDWSYIMALLDRNIYVAGNDVSDNYNGRGISVVGGADITIENNAVSRVTQAAGLYIQRERSWMSLGDHNILARGNSFTDIENTQPEFKPASVKNAPAQHGVVEIGSDQADDEMSNATYREALSISHIAITDNVLKLWSYAPVRIGIGNGPVYNVTIERNSFSNGSIRKLVEIHPGLQLSSFTCAANRVNGAAAGSCGSDIPSARPTFSVTGAALSCSANGILNLGPIPNAPSDVKLH